MKRNCVPALLVALMLAGCAADLSNYAPPLDPALATPQTSAHLAYCKSLIETQAQTAAHDWKTTAQQAAQSSVSAWVNAAELATATAIETAAAYTVFGALLGVHTTDLSAQADAESRVRMCMINYGEAVTEKP